MTPFEDVFHIEHGDIPASYVSLPEGISGVHRPSRQVDVRLAQHMERFQRHFRHHLRPLRPQKGRPRGNELKH